MVYCPKCGKKNEDDAEYCSKCGVSLTGKKKQSKINKHTSSLEKNVEDFAEEVVQIGKKAGKTIEQGVKNLSEEIDDIGEREKKEIGDDSSPSSRSQEYKRLYRSGKDRYMGGVCGGVAEYFKIDPTLIRILWVIIVFFPPGLGAIMYILFWIFVPRNPSHSWQ